MATKRNSKAKRSTQKQPAVALPIKATLHKPSEKEFAAFGRRLWHMQAERDREEASRLARMELEAQEQAAAEAAGITLKGAQLGQAQSILAAINSGADAARNLAVSAICTSEPDEQGAYLVGIENIAVVICRKVDVLARLMGDGGFGNFENEFAVVKDTAPGEAAECAVP